MKLSKDSPPGSFIYDWWRMIAEVHDPSRKEHGDRAGRAMLRRAPDITAVTLCAPYQRLYQKVRTADESAWSREHRRDGLAAAIGLLVHVEREEDRPLAAGMSREVAKGERAELSELRFQRLLESPDLDALFRALRRALPLMGRSANVMDLVNDVIDWSDPRRRDDVKKRWAYSYHWPTASAGK